MAYCSPHGIPHSFFLGGPHQWTQDDRDKVLAWRAMERRTCQGCGTRPEEWNPNEGGDRKAYTTQVQVCPGCEVRERGEAELAKDDSRKNLRGKQLVMVPNVLP